MSELSWKEDVDGVDAIGGDPLTPRATLLFEMLNYREHISG